MSDETEMTPSEETTDATREAIADWRSGLADDLRDHPTIQETKSLSDLAKRTIDLSSKLGSQGKIVPDINASDEDWEAFYNAAGRPTTPEEYHLKAKEDGMVNESELAEFSEFAHKIGLNSRQASKLLSWQEGRLESGSKELDEVMEANRDRVRSELEKEYGNKLDDKLEAARILVREVGGDDLAKDLESSGWGNSKPLLKFIFNMSERFGEDMVLSQGKQQTVAMAPADAAAEKARLLADPGFKKVYLDKGDPGHVDARDKILQLERDILGKQNRTIHEKESYHAGPGA